MFRAAEAGYHPATRGHYRCGEHKGRSTIISASTAAPTSETHSTGSSPGTGTFSCLDCGWQLSLQQEDALPSCAQCDGTSFRRHSIFEPIGEVGGTLEFAPAIDAEQPGWLDEVRASLAPASRHLAYEDDGEVRSVPLVSGWTRIGRSVAANVRLDDPSVSRRHALIVSEPDASLRILDDRSLNGVFVNGERIEWGKLTDGDQLTIGRYQLFVLES